MTTQRRDGLQEELQFWEGVMDTGGDWPEEWRERLDPESILQDDLRTLLPAAGPIVRILDVGAGPATTVNKKWPGHDVRITAIDPLGAEYNVLLRERGIHPPVETLPYSGETIHKWLEKGHYDLAHARNSLDHSEHPVEIIESMLDAVKPGCCVYLQHSVREADKQNHKGLHAWNFYAENGQFFIAGSDRCTNVSLRFEGRATIGVVQTEWVYTTLWKHR